MPKMALLEPNYISEIKPFRFPAGAVIDVDAATAERWLENGVAEPAKQASQTFREQRKAELAAELAALQEADEDDAPSIITMSDGRGGQPKRRRGPNKRVGRTKPIAQSVVMPGPSSEMAADEDAEE